MCTVLLSVQGRTATRQVTKGRRKRREQLKARRPMRKKIREPRERQERSEKPKPFREPPERQASKDRLHREQAEEKKGMCSICEEASGYSFEGWGDLQATGSRQWSQSQG